MSNLELKRKELEIIKVKASKHELEFKILEKHQEIERLEDNIKIQADCIIRLEKELEAIASK